MRKGLSLALAAVAAMFAAGNASAIVYLKPLASGETRTTQDGASWATAYTDAATAIAAAQNDADSTLYAAAGVYVVKAKITLAKALAVYGGFAGTDGETLDTRNISENETIFSGDVNGDDVWVHYVLDKTNVGNNNRVKVETLTNLVVKSGKFCAPPAYTDDYDIYAPPSSSKNTTASDNTAFFMEMPAGVPSLLISGVTFTGFYDSGNKGNLINGEKSSSTATMTLTDCRFVGNASCEASVWSGNARLTAKNLVFAYCYAHRNAGLNLNDVATVSDCAFESIYGTGSLRASAIFMHAGYGLKLVESCTFTRLAKVSYTQLYYGGPSVAINGEQAYGRQVVRNSVVSNCYGIVTGLSTQALPIINPNCGYWQIENCRFSKNYGASQTKTDGVYTLFGAQRDVAAGNSLWRDCVFDQNVHESYATSAAAGSAYALGIAGSATNVKNTQEATFVNCVFDRNEAGERTASGADVTRADVLSATANGYAMRTSVANCTFRQTGDDSGFAAVARYGTAHTTPLNVVNCLVMSDVSVAMPFAAPDGLTEANGICARHVTAQNVLTAPSCLAKAEDWQSDATPFATSDDGVLTPSVRTPGIRSSADVACYDPGLTNANGSAIRSLPEYRFKTADGWQPLNVAAVTSNEATLIGDITSEATARPSGSFTRGAVQVLGDAAENGKALVIRCSPLKGGTLNGPSAQSVADGAAATSVTAVPADGATFGGWYDATTNEKVSEETTLSLESVAADRVLVAKFLTQEVTLTFVLGDGGTFADGGASTITLKKYAGDVFPAVPEYAASADWVVLGFSPALPDYVPGESATYTAELLTTASRVFRVVPTADVPTGSDKTGSSWANATDDIAAAVKDAARYRGELWLKEGVYVVPATAYPLLSNVGVYGGFAGTEETRDAADPKAHVTVLTGDVAKDDYWLPERAEPAAADRQSVFDYEAKTFLRPVEKDGGYSTAHVDGYGGIRNYAFSTTGYGVATNAVVSGLVFTRFYYSAIQCDSDSKGSQLTVEDCAFYACGSEADASCGGVECWGAVTARNCTFVYCHGGLSSCECALGGPSLVENCTFDSNRARYRSVLMLGNTVSPGKVKNCAFVRNRLTMNQNNYRIILFKEGVGSTFEDSRVEGNVFHLMNVDTDASVQSLLYLQDAAVSRCTFVGNTNATKAAKGNCAALFYVNADNRNFVVRDSYFADNAMLVTNASSTANAASIAAIYKGVATFLNCTIKDNVAKSTANGYACTATQCGVWNSGIASVDSVFANNVIDGGTGSAELVRATDSNGANSSYGLAAVNSVFYNTASGYLPLRQEGACPLIVSSSYFSNVKADGSDYDLTSSYTLWTNVVTGVDPKLGEVKTDATTGVTAMGLAAGSPLAKRGVPAYVASDGFVYIYDDVSTVSKSKPWRRLVYVRDMYASVNGLTKDEGLVPDAFGQARTENRVALGPLNAPVAGFMLIVR